MRHARSATRTRTMLYAWLALACQTGCAHTRPAGASAHPTVPPAALLQPSAIAFDFLWRQRVTASWPTGQQSFDAVLQKQKDELLLLGLSPLGLPGFVLRLPEHGALQVENRTGQELPFEPGYVMADVQRVFFPWLPVPDRGWSGEQNGRRGDCAVFERYQSGRLVTRRFERLTPAGLERVTVQYAPQPGAAGDAPQRAQLENKLLGYTLSIETLEQSRLP